MVRPHADRAPPGESPLLSAARGISPSVVERYHGPNETNDHRAGHGQGGRDPAASRGEGTSGGRLRDDQDVGPVLRPFDGVAQRQEYESRTPSEDTLRCEDREDRGGAWQQPGIKYSLAA